MRASKVRDFSRDFDYHAFSIVRVFNGCLEELGGRNAWVVVSSDNKRLYRRAQGAGGNPGLPKDGIELDYDSRTELGVSGRPDGDGFYSCQVTISPATPFESFLGHWQNPRVEYQFAFRLAVLSVGLGFIGLMLGLVSLVLTLK